MQYPEAGPVLPYLATLDPGLLEQLLSDLPEADARILYEREKHDWRGNWARWEQIPPDGDWRYWILVAGRGSGKTRPGSQWSIEIAEEYPGCRIGLIGATKADVRDVMVEGESGILAVSPTWFWPHYEPSKRRLTWPNGTVATTYSADEPEQTRGANLHFAWADEVGKWRDPKTKDKIRAWENLILAVRLGAREGVRSKILVTTTPRRVGRGAEIVKDLTLGRKVSGRRPVEQPPPEVDPAEWRPKENTVVRRFSTQRNKANLEASFLADLDDSYGGTTLEAQEVRGLILEAPEGALFDLERIQELRRSGVPRLIRLLVSIDPSHQEDGAGDEAGIIVGGLGEPEPTFDEDTDLGPLQHVYILDDRTLRASPYKWGQECKRVVNQYRADGVVIEVTTVQTEKKGHVVRDTMRLVDPKKRINWIEVHSSSDKRTRAEPVAALYQQGRVHHVRDAARPRLFDALEDELVSWDPSSRHSPNRLDAMVHLVTELLVKEQRAELRLL